MSEYKSFAKRDLIILEHNGALKCYPEEVIIETTMKQKAHRT